MASRADEICRLAWCQRREIVIGEEVRDWSALSNGAILFPYNSDICLTVNAGTERALWPWKALLLGRRDFGNRTYREVGRSFAEYHQIPTERNRTPLTITFGEVASHNHFVLDRGGKVFNRTAPINQVAGKFFGSTNTWAWLASSTPPPRASG